MDPQVTIVNDNEDRITTVSIRRFPSMTTERYMHACFILHATEENNLKMVKFYSDTCLQVYAYIVNHEYHN